MTEALLCFAGDAVPAARALAEGAALAASLAEEGGPRATLYGAGLSGGAISVGAFQRASAAVRADASRVVRRRTGGVACHAGDGVVYLALGLASASVLMPCPRDRVLNRNVRGLLTGLTSAGGAPALYFGRDVVSVQQRPAALVSWDRDAHGRVLLEVFVSVTRSFALDAAEDGYAPRAEPPFRGKAPLTLAEAWGEAPSSESLVRAVAERGYGARFGLEWREAPAPALQPLGAARDDATLRWSPPTPIAIGFVQAGLAEDAGTITGAGLAGDFFADRDAEDRFRARVFGRPARREAIAAALDATFGHAGDAVIEGVRALDDVLRAFEHLLA